MAQIAEGGCCTCCCSFIFTSGLTALFMWLTLRTSKPNCYIQEFYVPALNKTQNITNNHTISFNLKLANGMKDKGVYYSNINLTFFYRDKNYNVSIANYTIPGFHQGHKKTAHRKASLEASGLPWEAALDAIANGSTANFTVGLASMVKFKIMFWHTKRHRLVVRGDVAVNGSGKNAKKAIKLKSSAPNPGCHWVRKGLTVIFIAFLLLQTVD